MTAGVDAILVALALSNLALLSTSRLPLSIRLVAAQGASLGLLPLVSGEAAGTRALLLAAGTAGLKGALIPWLLARARSVAGVRREPAPFVGYRGSLAFGILALAISFWLGARLPAEGAAHAGLVAPLSLFTILTGLFLIVARRTALAQVIGYLVLENGIYAFGVLLVGGVPALVELGVLLDVLVGVFVMGIAIYRIRQEFDHIDVAELQSLKG